MLAELTMELSVAAKAACKGGPSQGSAVVDIADEGHQAQVRAVVDETHSKVGANGMAYLTRVDAEQLGNVVLGDLRGNANRIHGAAAQGRRRLHPPHYVHELVAESLFHGGGVPNLTEAKPRIAQVGRCLEI